MREILPLNNGWLFRREPDEPSAGERVDLPHANVVLPYNYLREADYQFVSLYEKALPVPEEWAGRRVFLYFEGAMAYAEVSCNGRPAGSHKGGYTPFCVELTGLLAYGQENRLTVRLDSTERPDFPPCGGEVDYLTYGGIYREVSLLVTEPDFVRELRVSPRRNAERESVEVDVLFGGPLKQDAELHIAIDGHGVRRQAVLEARAGQDRLCAAFPEAQALRHWTPEDPALYRAQAELRRGGETVDRVQTRFGMRFCEFRPDGFYLNGQRRKLIGLNRHQSYPYVGGAMPARVQRRDADILKGLGINLVRTSHYPQSRHFLDRCDEIGLLAFEEIPGWQHIGDAAWQDAAVENVREMIRRDYNHPCIILWGVRINESPDCTDFYRRTNQAAHELDDTRQTGGVRCFVKSELLEDVYTFNEFIHNGGQTVFRSREEITGLEQPVPLLITESNGHMFPTKRFDHESRQVEHALRHLRVMNEALGREDVTGEISWCAFDYNTHSSFGSGDKICYHGVSDMFRLPKYAGLACMSQRPPEQGPVLEPLSLISRGERDGGGILPIWVATNCDFVRVYRNGELVGDFAPRRAAFPHLPHPPVLINHLTPQKLPLPLPPALQEEFTRFIAERAEQGVLPDLLPEDYPYLEDLAERAGLERGALINLLFETAGGWGKAENTLRLEGYVGGQAVLVREVGEGKSFARLEAQADDTVLRADGDSYDATRIVVRALDTLGGLCPFCAAGLRIETEGPVQVIGPDTAALIGGCIAFWVRTCGKTGPARVRINSGNETQEVLLDVRSGAGAPPAAPEAGAPPYFAL
ncbi:MAG TPA: glycoside hydrolase family 2 protein [Firmicutes bacterium]|nr:glycoside hydrolase family 2 protein [Bacillota bacterium]